METIRIILENQNSSKIQFYSKFNKVLVKLHFRLIKWVTLPSNGSSEIYKNNTQSNFTNKLSIPLTLSSNYEVALVGISYFEYIKINLGYIIFSNPINKLQSVKLEIYAYESEPIDHFVQRINKAIDEKLVEHLFNKDDFKNNDYDKMINDLIEKNLKDKSKIYFINKFNKLYLIIPIGSVTFHGDLLIKYFELEKTEYSIVGDKLLEIDIKPISQYKQINIINVMFIYTDFIQDQIVGDQLVPLLRNIVSIKNLSNGPITEPPTALIVFFNLFET